MTYSRITQATAPASLPNFNTPTITKEELLKINIRVAHAQFKNQEKPGTYKYELNRILKANNLPSIVIPDDTDIASDNINAQQAAGAMTTDVSSKEPETQIPTPAERKQSIPETSKGKILDPGELGLELHTTKEKGCPLNFTTKALIKRIQSNTYKFKYNDSKCPEELILKKIGKGEINLQSNCWFRVENDEFRKIRPGLQQDLSPLENRDPCLNKKQYNN